MPDRKSGHWTVKTWCLAAVCLVSGAVGAQPDVVIPDLSPPSMSVEPVKWAILVGASSYDDPAIAALPDASTDAVGLRDALTTAPKGFTPQCVTVLTGERSTRAVIIVALKDVLTRAGAKDVVYFHYSGNPLKSETGELILATKDTSLMAPVNTGLPFSLVMDLFGASKVGQVLVTVDGSHGGAGAAQINKIIEKGKEALFLASCSANEIAQPAVEYHQGALTHFLIEGLSGKADKTGNGIISCRELVDYSSGGLLAWLKDKGIAQTLVIQGSAAQFAFTGASAVPASPPTALQEPEAPLPDVGMQPPAMVSPPVTPVKTTLPPVTPVKEATAQGTREPVTVSVSPLAPPPAPEPDFAPPLAEQSSMSGIPGISGSSLPNEPAFMPSVTQPPAGDLPTGIPTPATFTGTVAPVDFTPKNKWALVVGIDQYLSANWPALQGSVNDAILMRDILVNHLGFDAMRVNLLTNEKATQVNIVAGLRDIAAKAQPEDLVLVYFSGHAARLPNPMGYEQQGRWFVLCPQDTQVTGQGLLAFPLVTGILSELKARQIIFVIDALNAAGAAPFLERLNTLDKSCLLLAACSSEQNAVDRPIQLPTGETMTYSVFTYYFAKTLRDGMGQAVPLTAASALQYVQSQLKQTGMDQTPEMYGKPAGLVLAGGHPQLPGDAGLLAADGIPPLDLAPAQGSVDEATAKIKKWAVIVGINKYKSEGLPALPGAVNDSKEINSLFGQKLGFEKAGIKLLNDDKATRQAILDAWTDAARKADAEDTVVFYFSGHSSLYPRLKDDIETENELVLCSSDADLNQSGMFVSTRDIFAIASTMTAKQIILILETSHAAAAGIFIRPLMDQGKKCILLSGCGWAEQTFDAAIPLESGKTKTQGAFTYYLADGLRGAAAKKDSKGITLKDAVEYSVKKLQSLGFKQKPQMSGLGSDFILVYSSKKSSAAKK
ncbi:MAG TPA: caspase family protein [Candidatus Hydrogenedentes bacterium]|nr:caspase family protein [Candidatus Hydrogenedentota bacterium]